VIVMNELETQQMWQEACAVALGSLPDMTPARSAALLCDRSPDAAWQLLATNGALPAGLVAIDRRSQGVVQKWRALARRTDPLETFERYRKHDIGVWTRFGAYPARLLDDEHAPAIAFYQGDPTVLSAPTVAIIGTRHCTQEGRSLARMFGVELSEAGVSVVSGLALGIDGAAHEGALGAKFGAPPVGVVGSGLDIVYPKRHHRLWVSVREKGLLISESALGVTPEPWRFPARNRIIAGLADLVLVIESHDSGGSLLTVDEAGSRGIPVMAVPGPIRSPASKGTNRLLQDGAVAACSTQDILDALQWESARPMVSQGDVSDLAHRANDSFSVQLDPADLPVLEAVEYRSTSTDEILQKTCLSLGEVAVSLTRLQAKGLVIGEAGWWCRTQSSEGVA
jgi:DNA processing protein